MIKVYESTPVVVLFVLYIVVLALSYDNYLKYSVRITVKLINHEKPDSNMKCNRI